MRASAEHKIVLHPAAAIPKSTPYQTQAHCWPKFCCSSFSSCPHQVYFISTRMTTSPTPRLNTGTSPGKKPIPPHQFPVAKAASKQVSVTKYMDKTYATQVNRNLQFISLCPTPVFSRVHQNTTINIASSAIWRSAMLWCYFSFDYISIQYA